MIDQKTETEIRRKVGRKRGLLEACVEADGSATFTPEELEDEVADFEATLRDRAERGVDLIPTHE